MRAQKYQEILNTGFAGGQSVCLGCVNLGDDILVIMSRHPDSEYGLDGSVCIINNRLMCDAGFQQRFRQRIRELNHCITDDMESAGLDVASLALCYFAVAVDTGHIDPGQAPLTKAIKMSELEGWAAEMIACHVYSRYIDGQKFGECGSQQQVEVMQ